MLKQVLILVVIASLIHETSSTQYGCNTGHNLTDQEKRVQATPSFFGQFVLAIGGSIGVLLNAAILLIIIIYPSARKAPSDIIIVICIAGFFEAFHLQSAGIYLLVHNILPEDSSAFCQTNGAIGIFGSSGLFLFSLGFTISPNIIVNNTLKQVWKKFAVSSYIAGLSLITGQVLYCLLRNEIRTTLTGFLFFFYQRSCFFRGSSLSWQIFVYIFQIIFIGTAIGSILYFRKVVPKNAKTRQKRGTYLTYFKTFLAVILSIELVQNVLLSLIGWSCSSEHFEYQYLLTNSEIVIAFLACSCRPVIFIMDPRIKAIIQRLIASKQDKGEESQTLLLKPQDADLLSELTSTVRVSSIYSCIAGILMLEDDPTISICELIEDDKLDSESSQEFQGDVTTPRNNAQSVFTPLDSKQMQTVHITEELVGKALQTSDGMVLFQMKVSLLAPTIFQYLRQHDHPIIDIKESLDLSKNVSLIGHQAGPDGGKSGEFMFFTHDNQLVIKSLGYWELHAIRKRLLKYGNYLVSHPNSLIAKIYGIYTLQRKDQVQRTHLIVMRNICLGVPRNYVMRTFDMKGSAYDREVLAKKMYVDASKVTLKDLDFFKTEQTLQINAEQAACKELSLILQSDANFFKDTHLIDYSLLVLKVDWKKYCDSTNQNLQQTVQQFDHSSFHIKSETEEGIYYHLAIIDYLQEWNMKKVMEQQSKKIIHLNGQLDTSAQNPQIYAQRFIQKLVLRILVGPPSDNTYLSNSINL